MAAAEAERSPCGPGHKAMEKGGKLQGALPEGGVLGSNR